MYSGEVNKVGAAPWGASVENEFYSSLAILRRFAPGLLRRDSPLSSVRQALCRMRSDIGDGGIAEPMRCRRR